MSIKLIEMKITLIVGLALCSFVSFSQEKVSNPNPHSAFPIDEADIQYKTKVWRKMDLKEKINQPFFSNNNEISKFLLEGVRMGLLKPYANDSLNTVLTKDEFAERMINKSISMEGGLSEAEKAAGLGGKSSSTKPSGSSEGTDDGWGGSPVKESDKSAGDKSAGNDQNDTSEDYNYLPKDITIIEIREDAIIDRKRSRLYFDIQSLTLKVPASDSSGTGIEEAVASFSFKEVHEYFKNRKECIWFNPNNEMQHRNMADAFDLRFFTAPIIKKGNGADQFILDQKGMTAQKALIKSQKLEQQIQDKEAEMWEN